MNGSCTCCRQGCERFFRIGMHKAFRLDDFIDLRFVDVDVNNFGLLRILPFGNIARYAVIESHTNANQHIAFHSLKHSVRSYRAFRESQHSWDGQLESRPQSKSVQATGYPCLLWERFQLFCGIANKILPC